MTIEMRFKAGFPDWMILTFILVVCLLAIIGPTVQAFYYVEITPNEGWNAYNAEAANHHDLYPLKYGWKTVNYPFLSFYLIGKLSRIFGDPVMIGRMLCLASFLISCALVSFIIKRLTRRWGPAIFGASFCLVLFSAMAPQYVAQDDPQMLAQPFLLLSLLLYLKRPASNWTIFS